MNWPISKATTTATGQAEGAAFGSAPAKGTLAGQQRVDGFQGQGLVNTFLGGDRPHGKLTSPSFTISRRYISFLVGGGNHAAKTCINLLVDGQVVRSTTGRAAERLSWQNWNVRELEGKEARIEIVDAESGPWGHINVDQIELTDRARTALTGPLENQPDFGTMGIAVLGPPEETLAVRSLAAGELPGTLFDGQSLAPEGDPTAPLGRGLCGAVGRVFAFAARPIRDRAIRPHLALRESAREWTLTMPRDLPTRRQSRTM